MLYANHATKVCRRYDQSRPVYKAVGLTDSHFASLLRKLRNYETERRALPAAVIHGDPFLTNVLVDSSSSSSLVSEMDSGGGGGDGGLRFIDMRGAQGDCLTLAGDAVYDLAKMLQSLLGYDVLLADEPLRAGTVDMLCGHLRVYWEQVRVLYTKIRATDILTVCCGLVTSLIPLHDNSKHQREFATMAKVLLQACDEAEEGADGFATSGEVVRKVVQARLLSFFSAGVGHGG